MRPDLDFTAKASAQRYSAEHGLMIVAPDTSPRGDDVADDGAYYLSQGAGFYVDAQMSPWATKIFGVQLCHGGAAAADRGQFSGG